MWLSKLHLKGRDKDTLIYQVTGKNHKTIRFILFSTFSHIFSVQLGTLVLNSSPTYWKEITSFFFSRIKQCIIVIHFSMLIFYLRILKQKSARCYFLKTSYWTLSKLLTIKTNVIALEFFRIHCKSKYILYPFS